MRVFGFEVKKAQKEKNHKDRIKSAAKLKKKVATTMDWIDIDEVSENMISLSKGSKKEYIQGIKIKPVNIFILPKAEQAQVVALLRSVFNDISFRLYHSFVFSPVNLDSELAYLLRCLEIEKDELVSKIYESDIEKMLLFINTWKEIEFFIMLKDSNQKKLQENKARLVDNMRYARFVVTELNRIDFENYLAYELENQLINDYLFSHGAFEILNQERGDIHEIVEVVS